MRQLSLITAVVGSSWTPFAISTQIAPTPSHAGPHWQEHDTPTTAHGLTIYLLTASWPRSILWQQTSCQRWRGRTTAQCGGSWAARVARPPNLLLSVRATCQSLQADSRNCPASLSKWSRSRPGASRETHCLDLKKKRRRGRIYTLQLSEASTWTNDLQRLSLCLQKERKLKLQRRLQTHRAASFPFLNQNSPMSLPPPTFPNRHPTWLTWKYLETVPKKLQLQKNPPYLTQVTVSMAQRQDNCVWKQTRRTSSWAWELQLLRKEPRLCFGSRCSVDPPHRRAARSTGNPVCFGLWRRRGQTWANSSLYVVVLKDTPPTLMLGAISLRGLTRGSDFHSADGLWAAADVYISTHLFQILQMISFFKTNIKGCSLVINSLIVIILLELTTFVLPKQFNNV